MTTVSYAFQREMHLPMFVAILLKKYCDMCLNYITNQNQLDQSLLFIYFEAYTNNEANATDSTFEKLNVTNRSVSKLFK